MGPAQHTLFKKKPHGEGLECLHNIYVAGEEWGGYMATLVTPMSGRVIQRLIPD